MPLHEAKEIIDQIQTQSHRIKENMDLFEIYEGQLLTHVDCALRDQLSPQSYEQAKHRIAPINVLRRIIDKLSKIYQQGPTRTVIDGNERDAELLSWYENKLRVNEVFNQSNEFVNLQKNNLIEIFLDGNEPKIRSIPAHQFWPYSDNEVDPTEPTHFAVFDSDKVLDKNGKMQDLLRIYSDEMFVIVDSEGDIVQSEMNAMGNPEGINPVGVLPFTYVNTSANLLVPLPDTDTKCMSVLIPILLTDLNHAVQFQSFSMIYGIDVDVKDIKRSPNAFLDLKSDPASDKNPQIGSIKPQVDIDQVLGLVASEFSLWLNTRGIKPGSIGQLNRDNFASGVSKMIDEMDVSEHRQKQVTLYQNVEADFWDRLLHNYHPFWVANGMIENRQLFSPNAKVQTNFKPQVPMLRRGDLIKELESEMMAGFTTKRRAIKMLNPQMTDDEIDELIRDIEDENLIRVSNGDGMATDEN